MKKVVLVLAIVGVLSAGALPALADDSHMDCPEPGPEFGPHIAQMAPEHAQRHGAMFGAMVSAMAHGEPCPHM